MRGSGYRYKRKIIGRNVRYDTTHFVTIGCVVVIEAQGFVAVVCRRGLHSLVPESMFREGCATGVPWNANTDTGSRAVAQLLCLVWSM